MKQFLLFFLFLSLIGCAQHSIAQTEQKRNQLVFEKLQRYINNKSTDSIYALLDDKFQKQFSQPMIEGMLVNNVYKLGNTTESKVTVHRDGVSTYKVSYANGVQKVALGTDNDSRIYTLSFRPWKDEEKIVKKDHAVATSNKLATQPDKKVDTVARRYIEQLNTVGLAIGMYKDGMMLTYGYGETVKGNSKVPTNNTLFEIGSITKTFTATLLAYYVQKEKVKLSDPIVKYLPDSVAANKALQGITLQMLSNHTSGLPRVPFNLLLGADNEDPYKEYSEDKLFYFLKNCKPLSEPGTKYDYSNTAAGLLAVILERVSGMPFESMVQNVITEPLGMTHIWQHLPESEKTNFTSVYDEKGNEVKAWNFEALAGAGCLRSSIDDLLRYAAANMTESNTPLSKAMSLTHQLTCEQGKVGLGWHFTGKDNQWLWHNGGTAGSSSFVAFNPEKKIAVAVLSNAATSVDDIARDLMEIAKQP